jgi:tRNA (guanine10-N2)-dimethyltransferase
MIQSIAINGRQPGLGRAELESLYGADNLRPIGDVATGLDLPVDQIKFVRLGGTIKLARVLTSIDSVHWPDIESYLAKTIPEHLQYVPEGKLKFGLSVYGLGVSRDRLNATGLSLKKVIKAAGRSVRLVPNKEVELNSASVLHNQLTGPTGWELLLIKDGSQTWLAQTVHVQDIDAYAARDQARPKRDARVGMLPPKLAQIIVNLAKPGAGETVLDPFCGTGVILQEALLMGRYAYGTDLEPRMIDYTRENLEWLIGPAKQKLAVGDATSYQWEDFDVIAAETYLGRPFSALPSPTVLDEVRRDVDTIHRKFLKNVAAQTATGFRMCIAVPAWKTKTGFQHLKTLDSLEELGYTRLSFVHVGQEDLIYHRDNQIVGRELVTLIRK